MNIVELKTNWRNISLSKRKNYESNFVSYDFVKAHGTEVAHETHSVLISYENKDIISIRDWLSSRCSGKYRLLARFDLNDKKVSYIGVNHCFDDQNDAALFKLMFS